MGWAGLSPGQQGAGSHYHRASCSLRMEVQLPSNLHPLARGTCHPPSSSQGLDWSLSEGTEGRTLQDHRKREGTCRVAVAGWG